MKSKFCVTAVFLLMLCGLLFCACEKKEESENPSSTESAHPGYRELLEAGEVTVEENRVRIALGEDKALPYRWEITEKTSRVRVTEEYTVDKPDHFTTAAGSAPALHVFELELSGEESIAVEFDNMWVNSRDKADGNGHRRYVFEYGQTGWELMLALYK